MHETLRCALFTPISPTEVGNGLAHRSRFWQQVLLRLGSLTTIVIPVSGPPRNGDLVVPLVDSTPASAHLPQRSRRAPESHGRTWAAERDGFDLVVALRAYIAPFALGAVADSSAAVVVDLDDDDADLLDTMGDREESQRFRALVRTLHVRADCVVSIAGFGDSIAVPNSVPFASSSRRGDSHGAPKVLMVGNFTYPPNAEGARWFLDQVFPAIARTVPGVALSLVGPGSEAFAPFGLGYCEDLAGFYAQASVAIVPLLHGSGSRIKAIEAFAHRVPVVGTTVGLEGLGVVDGVHCHVRDDANGFAAAVTEVLNDPTKAAALAERAHADLATLFAQHAVVERTVLLMHDVLERLRCDIHDRAPHLTLVETDDGLVVMDEVSLVVHHLNPFASAVFILVDGKAGVSSLVAHVRELFDTAATEDVQAAVEQALSHLARSGLVVRRGGRAEGQ